MNEWQRKWRNEWERKQMRISGKEWINDKKRMNERKRMNDGESECKRV